MTTTRMMRMICQQIFRIDNLGKDFNDSHEMTATHSLDLKPKRLAKGQSINLQKNQKLQLNLKNFVIQQ